MKPFRLLPLILLFLYSASLGYSQGTTAIKDSIDEHGAKITRIKDITDNPGKFENELVKVTGVVTQFTEGTSATTSFFWLMGNYGGLIKVNTSLDPPVTMNRYEILGTVITDVKDRVPILIERERVEIGVAETEPDYLVYILIGAVILLFVFVAIYIIRTRRSSPRYSKAEYEPEPEPKKAPEAEKSAEEPTRPRDESYSTIKITKSPPPTMVLVPGELEIIAGSDAGKTFKIAAYPGPEGSVVTIGRDAAKGDRKYAHIQLFEQTVSRKQAEIIYKNKQLFVKNLSDTNFTEIDGKPLSPGEQAEIQPNSVIKTGEVEFRYRR